MSSKLSKRKRNKPVYGWMEKEIRQVEKVDARKHEVAGFCKTMALHTLEISLWTLHDKFGFGKKRLERVNGIIIEYFGAHYEKEMNIHVLGEAVYKKLVWM